MSWILAHGFFQFDFFNVFRSKQLHHHQQKHHHFSHHDAREFRCVTLYFCLCVMQYGTWCCCSDLRMDAVTPAKLYYKLVYVLKLWLSYTKHLTVFCLWIYINSITSSPKKTKYFYSAYVSKCTKPTAYAWVIPLSFLNWTCQGYDQNCKSVKHLSH